MKASILTALLATGAIIEAQPVSDIEARDMTAAQNWCVAGGAVLAGIGTLTGGIAAIIMAANSAKDCGTKDSGVGSRVKRDEIYEQDTNEALSVEGFDMTDSTVAWDPATNASTFSHGIHSSTGARFDNLTIATDGSFSGLFASSDSGIDDAKLAKRAAWAKDRIHITYHATEKCHTTKSRSAIKSHVKDALHRHSDNQHQASCFALYAGGKWTGHLKVVDVKSNGAISPYYAKGCDESHTVARTC